MNEFEDLRNDPAISDGDIELIRSAITGDGVLIQSAEQLGLICNMAKETKDSFDANVADMTRQQAEFVRRLRVENNYTWRAVSHTCYVEFNGDWEPPSNQLMGMSLCERAAKFFGEDGNAEPWN